jgi:HNH endonuclease
MTLVTVTCSYCHKEFLRYSRHVNENKKLGHKIYCSAKCQGANKRREIQLVCENTICAKSFIRRKSDVSLHNFCSAKCAAIINNKRYPRQRGLRKNCISCNKIFVSREKYCSRDCKIKGQFVTKEQILIQIKEFYAENGRIPLKKEFHHPRAARERFGSWNNAIIAAGFKPNPLKFSKKYFAKDGHSCDSLAEMLIDDWLYKKNLNHKRTVPYPRNKAFTADFVVDKYWIEFFGLSGQHKRYDDLKQQKLALAKKYKLNLIELYPFDLFPVNKLEQKLLPALTSR